MIELKLADQRLPEVHESGAPVALTVPVGALAEWWYTSDLIGGLNVCVDAASGSAI